MPPHVLRSELPRLKAVGLSDVRCLDTFHVGHSTDGELTTQLSEFIVERAGLGEEEGGAAVVLQDATEWAQRARGHEL